MMGNKMTFDEFIEAIEDGEIVGRGYKTCSLDYRNVLKEAFEQGRRSGNDAVDELDFE